MTKEEVLVELKLLENENSKKMLAKHGAREPFYGVKVADLKKIQKKVKKNQKLALELYDTGISDAMYLAGLIADEKQMTEETLNDWVQKAYWYFLCEYTVAWIAAESDFGYELGLEWIKSEKENVASSGWSTLANVLGITINDHLDISKIQELMDYVEENIHKAQNRVRYTMNGFIISVGTYIPELTDKAIKMAEQIGKVKVDMGGTSCKVPYGKDYIQKVIDRGTVGKKRKMARC